MSLQRLLLLLLLFLILCTSSATTSSSSEHICSRNQSLKTHCPPFLIPPTTFPFSQFPGCNHPSFQIHCSTPYSLLIINKTQSFFILSQPNPISLLLSPNPNPNPNCPSLPLHPISLPSPFRLLYDPCHRLTPACNATTEQLDPDLADCNLTQFQSSLLRYPLQLFSKNCSSSPRRCIEDDDNIVSINKPHPHPRELLSSFLRTGFVVQWDLSADPYFTNCSRCGSVSSGVCGFNDSDPANPFLCFPSLDKLNLHSHPRSRTKKTAMLVLLVSVLFAVVCASLALMSFWVIRTRRKKNAGNAMSALFLQRHPPVYTYDQLRVSTNGFDPRRKIGDGGFGSVYLAQLDDGRIAAVKRLHRQHPAATTKAFCNEILILSSLRHPSLVRLHGYCWDPRGLLLVYDYVPNGTLADHLHGSRSLYRKGSLTWPVRVDMALQIASALEYLHFSLEPPVVHRDITSNNIFVERDMRIKVGDFGLSRLLSLPEQNSAAAAGSPAEYVCCTGPQGTPGYLDPDYHRSFRLTEKSDVYSFGVVLLELVTGMKAVDLRRDKREVALADLVVLKIQAGELREVVDPVLVKQQGEEMGTIEAVAELAFRCVAEEKDDRPSSREVVEELKRIKEKIQELAGKGS